MTMTDDNDEFGTARDLGRTYATVDQLRTAPEGTPIRDAKGRHWIRGFNDATEPRWHRRKAPRLIWLGIGVDGDRSPSSEVPLPATQVAAQDFWPTALVEGALPAATIGSIAGGSVGGALNPVLIGAAAGGQIDSALWDVADAATRRYWLDLGLTPVPVSVQNSIVDASFRIETKQENRES